MAKNPIENLTKTTRYAGQFSGITCEIVFHYDNYHKQGGWWTYYCNIDVSELKPEFDESHFNEFDIDEWHGGITYNYKIGNILKLGCDYNRHCDAGVVYMLESIVKDCAVTAKALKERFYK